MSSLCAFLSILAVVWCSLTAGQVSSQCGNQCINPLPSTGWISNIDDSQRRSTSVRLSWTRDSNLRDGLNYQVVWRDFDSQNSNFTVTRGPEHPSNSFTLMNLQPGRRYEALVCLPRFNLSTAELPPRSNTTFLPECGVCSSCFRTEDVSFEFLITDTARLPENGELLNLTCQVESNVDISIEWTAELFDAQADRFRRMRLNNGENFDGHPIEVSQRLDQTDGGRLFRATSELIISDSIFEEANFVECRATSAFVNRSSAEGAFQPVEPMEPAQTVTFPVWAIGLIVVLPLLIIICLVVFIVVTCVVLMGKRKKIIKLTDAERRLDKKSNTYLEGGFAAVNVPLHEKPLDSEAITELNGAIPKDMIIDSSLVDVSTVIGQGEFGVVYKGMLKNGTANQVVAVKSLKGIFVTETDVQNALREILKMKNFDHPNVMTLMGVCQATGVSGGAPSIIMPYMARGSLLSYLRKERDQLMPGADADITQVGSVQKLLMQICLQISKGMAYLASLRFVHRDLAARNCMIDEKGVIKVSDFGLAEDIYMRNYFRQSSQDTAVKLPLKWMAPESIKLGIFSEKSDVWSYGVTCWEVFTAGEIPYPGIHPQGVVQLLENGQHLSKPKNPACDDTILLHRMTRCHTSPTSLRYGLMNSCWAYRPEDRPKFEELASSLDNELTALAEYVDLSMFADESNVNTASEE